MNTSHLHSLELRLSHERARLAAAKSAPEIALRKVWVAQLEKEVSAELEFLYGSNAARIIQMTDEELIKELQA